MCERKDFEHWWELGEDKDKRILSPFYRAMQRRTWLSYSKSSVRLSICLWCWGYVFHTGWNISKIISGLIRFRFLLGLTPAWAIWSNGNTPKLGWNRAGDMSIKTCNRPMKRRKIGPRLLWWTNQKSHMCFRLAPKSMTLNILERPKSTVAEKNILRSPPEKSEWRYTHTISGKM